MQILGVTITTRVTFVSHDFEKLNLYIALMLFLHFQDWQEIYSLYVLQKEGKNKTCSYYLYDLIHFLEKKKKKIRFKAERTLTSPQLVWDITSDMDI